MKYTNSCSDGRRSWMPVIDRHTASADSRLWHRDAGCDFDWQSTDSWTRRVVDHTDANGSGLTPGDHR